MYQKEKENQSWWTTDTNVTTFRCSALWIIAILFAEISLLFFIRLFVFGNAISIQIFLRAMIFCVLSALLFFFAFPVKVSSNGIQGHNMFGIPQRAKWEEIEKAKIFNFVGFRFLCIRSSGGGLEMYMPLFLNNRVSFWEQISHFAPPENPIFRFQNSKVESPQN